MLSLINFKGFLKEVHGDRTCWTKQNWHIQEVKLKCSHAILHQNNSVHQFDYRHIFIFSKGYLRF